MAAVGALIIHPNPVRGHSAAGKNRFTSVGTRGRHGRRVARGRRDDAALI